VSAAATSSGRPSATPLVGLVALLLAAAVAIQVVRDRGWVPYQPPSPTLWVRSGPLMQRLSLSYSNLMADIYWIRAVTYYGGVRRSHSDAKNYEGLYPLLDMVTTLDPHFIVAYRFGAIFLTEAYPQGPGRPDQAIQLLERGIALDNGRWEYFHDIGFVYYWWLHDYQKAGEWFLRGAERPNAATWLKALAATTLASGGRRDSSRQLWTELLKSDMEFIHGQAETRLKQLDAMDMIDELTPVLRRFIDREHRLPASWQELAAAEHLPRVPVDPTGVPFVFDAKAGRIDVSRQSALSPLPVSPSTPPPPQ